MIGIATSQMTAARGLEYTKHALERMGQRGITRADIDRVLTFGRMFQDRGAVIHVIGQREIDLYSPVADLTALDGVHVVLTEDGLSVLTVYRNAQFREVSFCTTREVRRRARQRSLRRRISCPLGVGARA